MGKFWSLGGGCREKRIGGWWLWCCELQAVVLVDWFGLVGCGGFVVGVGRLVCLFLVFLWSVGSIDDFSLG